MAQINFWDSQGKHSLLSPCWLALTCIRARVHIAFSSGRKALAVHQGESRQPPLYDRWSTLAFCGLPPLFLMAEHQSIIAKGREKGRAMVMSPEPFWTTWSRSDWLQKKKMLQQTLTPHWERWKRKNKEKNTLWSLKSRHQSPISSVQVSTSSAATLTAKHSSVFTLSGSQRVAYSGFSFLIHI